MDHRNRNILIAAFLDIVSAFGLGFMAAPDTADNESSG